jgi:predicted branched-subunit amino acid permease
VPHHRAVSTVIAPDALTDSVGASRRRLMLDSIGITFSVTGFGLVYGLSARELGLTPLDVFLSSAIVFAGGAQFAALGYLRSGMAWPLIGVLTALINARHVFYSAVMAPYFAGDSRLRRAAAAHFLSDETFALALAHFRRLGRRDWPGYWFAALDATYIPWVASGTIAAVLATDLPDPARVGLDVIFPAAMAGLAVGLLTSRREVVAAVAGAVIGVAGGLFWGASAGIVLAGLLGPIIAMLVPVTEP